MRITIVIQLDCKLNSLHFQVNSAPGKMFGRSYTIITNTNPVTGQLTQNRISKRSVTESDVVVQFSLTKDRSSIKRVKSLKRVSSLKNLIAKVNRTLYNVDSSKVVYKAGLSKKLRR